MPVVTNTLKAPDGSLVSSAAVQIELAGTDGVPIKGYVTAGDYSFIGYHQPTVTNGVWSVTLVANTLINPSGTRWKVSETHNSRTHIYYLSVPDGAGPYFVEDILSDAPASVASPALQSHLDDTTAAHAASAVSFSPTGTVAATTVQAAIAEVDSEKVPITLAEVPTSGASTVFTAPVQSHGSDFQWKVENTPFTGDAQTVNNPVFKFGWNINGSSDSTTAGVHLGVEADYWTNAGFDGAWHHQTETHVGETWTPARTVTDAVFNSTTTVTSATAKFAVGDKGRAVTGSGVPGGTTIASVVNSTTVLLSAATTTSGSGKTITLGAKIYRPLTMSVHWAGQGVGMSLVGDVFDVSDSGGAQIFNWGLTGGAFLQRDLNIVKAAAALNLSAAADASSDATFYMNVASGRNARMKFQVAGATSWQQIVNSSGNIQFYDEVTGNVPVTFVRGASPTTGRLDLTVITKYADAGLFQTTVGAAGGGSALPATPTKYLKVQDNAGTTFVVPCYAAS